MLFPIRGAMPVGFLRSLPNALTILRLALIPVFMLLMRDPSDWMLRVATFLFIAAMVTDLLDGFIARFFRAESDFGRLVDPLADKILVMTALVMLVSLRTDSYGEPWVPAWMVVLILAREFWVTGMRGVAAARGFVLSASDGGKLKSFLQMVAIVFLMLHAKEVLVFGKSLSAQFVGLNLLFLSILVSLWSAYEYTVKVFAHQAPAKQTEE